MAIKVLDLELSEELNPIWGVEAYDQIRILVRYHSQPVGWIVVSNTLYQPAIPVEKIDEAITNQLGWELVQMVLSEPFNPSEKNSRLSEPISIVVCTRDRTDQLAGCLDRLSSLDYPSYEIIVVDNAPSSQDTAQLVSRYPVRYVCEPRPGLDWARNRGISEAHHDIIAFTDDDVRPDRFWLQSIAAAFTDLDVMAVSGLVAPAELETSAQIYFELVYGGMLQGLHRRTIRRTTLTIRELLWASAFGVGANMAFRRKIFDDIGYFDVALDVGTATNGGGDVEMFHRLVAKGHTAVYEPAALIWHIHRRTFTSLSKQIYDNGRGFGAYLLTCIRNRTVSPISVLRFAAQDWIGWWILKHLAQPEKLSRRLIFNEFLGALSSPFAYRAAQQRAQEIAATYSETHTSQSTIQGLPL